MSKEALCLSPLCHGKNMQLCFKAVFSHKISCFPQHTILKYTLSYPWVRFLDEGQFYVIDQVGSSLIKANFSHDSITSN